MANNWNSILSNTNNLRDVLVILQKVLASLDNKVDLTVVNEALENIDGMSEELQQALDDLLNNDFMEPFATEAALLTSRPEITKKAAKALDTKKLWLWDGNQWNDTGLSEYDLANQYTDEVEINVKKFSIDLNKSSISEVVHQSSNLFNIASAVENNTLVLVTGEISNPTNADLDWAHSDFIQVIPNQDYYFDGFRHIAYYDINKKFIQRITLTQSGNGAPLNPYKYFGSFVIPDDVYFIRLNYRATVQNDYLDGRKVNKGKTSIPYEPYFLDGKYLKLKGDQIFDSTIPTSKLNFIRFSLNKFNFSTATQGKVILVDGSIVDNVSYAISDYIDVIAGEEYTISCSDLAISPFTNISYYDDEKNFIARYNPAVGTSIFRAVQKAAYVRFNINLNSGALHQKHRMFNEGNVALPYQAWHLPKLVGVESESAINLQEVESLIEEKQSQIPTIEQYVEDGYNLFNVNTCTLGKAIDATGNLIDRLDYAISDYIAVEASQYYTISSEIGANAWIYTNFYDAQKNFISRIQTPNANTGYLTITTLADAAFVRFSINLNTGQPSERQRMFVKGEKILSYVPFRSEFTGLALAPDVLEQVGREVRLRRQDNFIFDYNLDELFTTKQTLGNFLNFNSSTSAQVYQMYDTLMSKFPAFVSKKELGRDEWGNPIALYKFKAPQPITSQSTRIPKVFITTGVHGMEHVSVLTTYLMFEQMLTEWKSDKLLEVLRNNVEFLIIPVCVPTAYNKYTRKNDNGVDINRNFPDGFGWQSIDPLSAYYGGLEPLDQLESKYIVQVFNENSDIDIMYDFHNFNGTSAELHPHLIWIAGYTGGNYVEHMTQKLVRKLTHYWRDKFEWIPRDETWFAGFSNATEGAMIKDYAAHSIGIPFTATFEVGGRWWIDPKGVPYDLNHKQSALEALVNFLLINLQELIRV